MTKHFFIDSAVAYPSFNSLFPNMTSHDMTPIPKHYAGDTLINPHVKGNN